MRKERFTTQLGDKYASLKLYRSTDHRRIFSFPPFFPSQARKFYQISTHALQHYNNWYVTLERKLKYEVAAGSAGCRGA